MLLAIQQQLIMLQSTIDIVFLQQPLDDVPFSLSHGSRFVVLFLLVRHNSRLLCFFILSQKALVFIFYRVFFTGSLNREIRRRTRVVGTFLDGNSALMLVCARLRHVAGTQWGNKKYMNMKHLEAACQDASIAD